jgi:hypothetical protein
MLDRLKPLAFPFLAIFPSRTSRNDPGDVDEFERRILQGL